MPNVVCTPHLGYVEKSTYESYYGTAVDNIVAFIAGKGGVAFIIGGADGLHETIKRSAQQLLALSALTLPHAFVRVLLAEQLYRALSLMRSHPYHRE
jgi:23S rRNA (pseudouridine1915-N3)-methyltransferase